MVKKVSGTQAREDEIVRLGKEGKTTLQEVADTWDCTTENIASYLLRLQERKSYAYIVDGNGCFKLFKELD